MLSGVLLLLMDVYSGDGRWFCCVTDLAAAGESFGARLVNLGMYIQGARIVS